MTESNSNNINQQEKSKEKYIFDYLS